MEQRLGTLQDQVHWMQEALMSLQKRTYSCRDHSLDEHGRSSPAMAYTTPEVGGGFADDLAGFSLSSLPTDAFPMLLSSPNAYVQAHSAARGRVWSQPTTSDTLQVVAAATSQVVPEPASAEVPGMSALANPAHDDSAASVSDAEAAGMTATSCAYARFTIEGVPNPPGGAIRAEDTAVATTESKPMNELESSGEQEVVEPEVIGTDGAGIFGLETRTDGIADAAVRKGEDNSNEAAGPHCVNKEPADSPTESSIAEDKSSITNAEGTCAAEDGQVGTLANAEPEGSSAFQMYS